MIIQKAYREHECALVSDSSVNPEAIASPKLR